MRYKDLDFVGLSKILRAHATQILPPGMRELKNVYVARSDNSVTLRPDFLQEITGMSSLSADLQGGNYPEFLTGIYRVLDIDGYIYFSNVGPFSFENELRTNISTSYKDGTVTTNGVRPIVNGSGTLWLERVWAGCLIREKGSDDWYRIVSVKSNVYLETSTAMPELTGAEYEILRTHPMENGEWPIQYEKLGDLLVYNPANPTLPVAQQKISGPFYSDVGKIDLFGSVWREFQPEIDRPTGNYNVVWAGGGDWPLIGPYPFSTIGVVLMAGEHGILVANKQWVGDYTSTEKNWLKIKEKYFFLDTLGRLVYPRGNGYPVDDTFYLLANSSDSPIIALDGYRVLLGNGHYFGIILSTPDLSTMTEEELASTDPITITYSFAPVPVIDAPAHGMFYQGHVLGGNGQVKLIGQTGLIPTPVTTDLWGGATGERVLLDPSDQINSGVHTQIIVGGVDEFGATVLGLGADLFTVAQYYRIIDYGIGDNELYGITYMHSLDQGPYGLGTWVAVGAYGTIIFSDDGGYTWEPAYSGTDLHIRKIDADMQGRCAMAVGDGGTCLVSQDAENWTQLDVGQGDISSVSYNHIRGEFVIALAAGGDPIRIKRRYEYGTNGVVVSKRVGIISTNPSDVVLSIIWDGSQFIAAGTDIWTSLDGVTWTDNGVGGSFACLAHDGAGVVVAVGQEGMIVRSSDSGATWAVIHAKKANPFIDGNILSVIWDGFNFFCCGDKVILQSADGITWAEDTSFDFDEQPRLMSYAGLVVGYMDYSNPHGIEEIFPPPDGYKSDILFGNLHVLCASGHWYSKHNDFENIYPNYEPTWNQNGLGELDVPLPDKTPASMVSTRSQFRVASTSIDAVRPTFWASSYGWKTYGFIKHEHLSGYANGQDVGDQEPGVLRGILGESTSVVPTALTGGSGAFNNLLLTDELEVKSYSNTILYWIHGTRLLISTDCGQTWSKGRRVVIPFRNNGYSDPVSGQIPPSTPIQQPPLAPVLNLTATPMVSDGENVFMSCRYAPEGLVFINLSWDGLQVRFFDEDQPPPDLSDAIPQTVILSSTANEKFVFTFYEVEVS